MWLCFPNSFSFVSSHLYTYAWTVVKVAQSWPTLCDPTDCSLPDSSFYGILQARILEWVVFPFSRGSSQPRNWIGVSCIAVDSLPDELPGKPIRLLCPQDSPTKNTGMGCHNLLLGNLPDPGIEPTSLMSPAQAGRFFTTSATWEAPLYTQDTLIYFGKNSLWYSLIIPQAIAAC